MEVLVFPIWNDVIIGAVGVQEKGFIIIEGDDGMIIYFPINLINWSRFGRDCAIIILNMIMMFEAFDDI